MSEVGSKLAYSEPKDLFGSLIRAKSSYGSGYYIYPLPFPCHLDKFLGIDHDVLVSEFGKSRGGVRSVNPWKNDLQQDSFKDGKEVAELNCHQEEENLIAKTH
ncbi:hypothetical protein RJ639_031082 [Escallonia herrerae]|uniref:Uncharacterized protein n=1 Tax=Escallonia herrerae TaxID=1293975 RepID=A0AA89BN97_9ASTE|nr:hypothetical protein RJ639_031082 [Escallonia herrerae]